MSKFSFKDFGNSNIFSTLKTPDSRYSAVSALFRKVVEEQSGGDPRFSLHLLQANDQNKLALPVIIATYNAKDEEGHRLGVGYHCVIVDSENYLPPVRTLTVGGKQYAQEFTPGEVYDRATIDVINEHMKNHYPDVPLHDGGARLLSRHFNLDDEKAVINLVVDVFAVAEQIRFENEPDKSVINLSQVEAIAKLRLIEKYERDFEKDLSGYPVRSDVALELVCEIPNHKPLLIGSIKGYIDVVPVGKSKILDQSVKHRFFARFVITQLTSTRTMTLSMQLILLAAATALSQENRWHNVLIQAGEQCLKLLDSRLENYLSMQQDELSEILNEVFHPGLIFSMDVGNASDSTWCSDVWAAAAHGKTEAMVKIYDTANLLTNGLLEDAFSKSDIHSIVFDEGSPIQLGHYTGRSGDLIDIRRLDQLTVMNLTQKDPDVGEQWADTFVRADIPAPIRMSKRTDIIRSLAPDVFFTDMATRVTFGVQFWRALRNGCGRYLQIKLSERTPKEKPRQYDLPSALADEATPLFDENTNSSGYCSFNWTRR